MMMMVMGRGWIQQGIDDGIHHQSLMSHLHDGILGWGEFISWSSTPQGLPGDDKREKNQMTHHPFHLIPHLL